MCFSYDKRTFGKLETIALKEGGEDIEVTDANKSEYVRLITQYKMTDCIKEQLEAFQEGFHDLIPKVNQTRL